MTGTCGKCARIVEVTRTHVGLLVEAHGHGGEHVCAGSGLAPRGVLEDKAPALVADVQE